MHIGRSNDAECVHRLRRLSPKFVDSGARTLVTRSRYMGHKKVRLWFVNDEIYRHKWNRGEYPMKNGRAMR